MSKIKLKLRKSPSESSNSIVLDLFCGCGGLAKGITDAGFKIFAGIDIWEPAIASYSKNYSHHAICADLTTLSPEEFKKLYNPPVIDIIIGGRPPCQGFSLAGKRDPKDPKNSLFAEYVKYLNYYLPKAFIMENVIGILSMI